MITLLENVPLLCAVDLSYTNLPLSALQALVASPVAQRLVSLNLAGNWHGDGDEAVEILAVSPQLTQLRQLDLADNLLTGRAISALASSESLTSLRNLNLYDHHCDEQDWLPLFRSPLMQQLRSLSLRKQNAGLGISTQMILEEFPANGQLRQLAINVQPSADVSEWLSLPWMKQLAELDVRCSLTSTGELTAKFGKWAENHVVQLRHK